MLSKEEIQFRHEQELLNLDRRLAKKKAKLEAKQQQQTEDEKCADLSYVCRHGNLRLGTLKKYIEEGKVDAPTHKRPVHSKLYYYKSDLPHLLKQIDKVKTENSHYFDDSGLHLAKKMQTYRYALTYHTRMGNIPYPQKIGRKNVWSPEDQKKVEEFFKEWENTQQNYVYGLPYLKSLGATAVELYYWQRNKKRLAPTPAKILGNSIRNKFYTKEQIKEVLGQIRKEMN